MQTNKQPKSDTVKVEKRRKEFAFYVVQTL